MTLRAAILGHGRSGSAMHAGAIEANRDFTLVAACDIDPERRRQAADRFSCAVYDDYHAMLSKESLDLVCVITRSDQHAAMACDCLDAGVNVLVTKPWAVNAAEGQRMIAARDRSGRQLLPWLPARWGASLARLRELQAEQAIGRVSFIRRTVSGFGTRCDWQTERRFGGGYLLNWGPHIIDPAVLLGNSPVRSVYGRMRQMLNPGDTEDCFLALLTLADGTLVQAEYTVAVEPFPDWILQGNRGTIVVRGNRLKIHRNTPAAPSDPTQFAKMQSTSETVTEETIEGATYGDEHQVYREIAQALRGERPFPVRPEDALALSRIFDAVRASNEENRVVEIV